jgi:hypothetical protein
MPDRSECRTAQQCGENAEAVKAILAKNFQETRKSAAFVGKIWSRNPIYRNVLPKAERRIGQFCRHCGTRQNGLLFCVRGKHFAPPIRHSLICQAMPAEFPPAFSPSILRQAAPGCRRRPPTPCRRRPYPPRRDAAPWLHRRWASSRRRPASSRRGSPRSPR